MKKLIGALAAAALFGVGCAHSQNESAEAASGNEEQSVVTASEYDEKAEDARGENVPPSGTAQDATVQAGEETWDTETSEPNLSDSEEDQSEAATADASGEAGADQQANSEVIDEGAADQTGIGGSGQTTDPNATDSSSMDSTSTEDSATGGSGTQKDCPDTSSK